MYKYVCIVFLFIAANASAQLNVSVKMLTRTAPLNSDTVYYNASKKLVWDNFKGTAITNSDAAAVTTSGFGYNAGISYDDESGEIEITVYCYFSKRKSWVKGRNKTAYILSHEQKHFDVTYIGACTFLKKIGSTIFTKENFSKELETIYKESYTTMQQMQDSYDNETMNGRIEAKQTEWNNRISSLLQNL